MYVTILQSTGVYCVVISLCLPRLRKESTHKHIVELVWKYIQDSIANKGFVTVHCGGCRATVLQVLCPALTSAPSPSPSPTWCRHANALVPPRTPVSSS